MGEITATAPGKFGKIAVLHNCRLLLQKAEDSRYRRHDLLSRGKRQKERRAVEGAAAAAAAVVVVVVVVESSAIFPPRDDRVLLR